MTVLVESLAVTNRDLFPKLQLTHCILEGSDIDIPVTTSGIASQADIEVLAAPLDAPVWRKPLNKQRPLFATFFRLLEHFNLIIFHYYYEKAK